MASPGRTLFICLALSGVAHLAHAQQAVSPSGDFAAPDRPPFANVSADGMALAQNDSAIEQARLRAQTLPPVDLGVNANGTALPDSVSEESEDDSLGAQRILKAEEPVRAFVVTGGFSLVYTNNVALTRRATRHDVFAIVDAGIGWTPRLGKNLEANFVFHASLFRYDRTPEFDFENLGFGAGLSYALPRYGQMVAFARYDFTELLDRDGHHLVMDHALSLGLQKGIALGRSYSVGFGAIGTLGVSDPAATQRSQIGGFIGFHLQLTRKLETDFLYRPAVYFYTDSGRTDFNQILSWSMRYRFNGWAELNGSFTYGANRSNRGVFDYDLLTAGGSAAVIIRF